MQRNSRLKRELQMLSTEPPPGVSCWQLDERVEELQARCSPSVAAQPDGSPSVAAQPDGSPSVAAQPDGSPSVAAQPDGSPSVYDQIFGWYKRLNMMCWTEIVGGANTPYDGGLFTLEIKIPDRYPFEPPKMRFLTPIYHPNIDNAGRICLDVLKLPPKGAWRPSLNISTVLSSVQLLMAEPNPDDPLMADISSELKYNKAVYLEKAQRWTVKYATQKNKGHVEAEQKILEDRSNKMAPKREALSAQENMEPPKRVCM